MKNEKVLFLFTAEFPFGKGESVIENELPIISKRFKHIYIYPKNKTTEEKRVLPINVSVIFLDSMRFQVNKKKFFFLNFFFILNVLFIEWLHCKEKRFFIKNIRLFNAMLINGIIDSYQLRKSIKSNSVGSAIYYSFWMDDSALALSIMKIKGHIEKFVFRCGGFDIFDERHPGNYLPFRYFIYKNTSYIYPNSLMGEQYIKNKKMFPEKVITMYLGTTDKGINRLRKDSSFCIVSCSRVVALKRIDLIIEVLKHLKFNVSWIHFGDGEIFNDIQNLAKEYLPINVSYTFKGAVNNKDVIDFYCKNSVNLFISTSETESLPVSIQEAISFGIPIVATDVGGVSEIVNHKTGYLIEKDFNPIVVANLISRFKDGEKNTEGFRAEVRQFWMDNFDAKKVYNSFSDVLLQDN